MLAGLTDAAGARDDRHDDRLGVFEGVQSRLGGCRECCGSEKLAAAITGAGKCRRCGENVRGERPDVKATSTYCGGLMISECPYIGEVDK